MSNETIVPTVPAIVIPVAPTLPVIDWQSYIDGTVKPEAAALAGAGARLLDGADGKRLAALADVEVTVAATVAAQILKTGQSGKLVAFIAAHIGSKSRALALYQEAAALASQKKIGVKMSPAEKVSYCQTLYAGIAALTIDRAILRKVAVLDTAVKETGMTAEQVVEKQVADRAAKAEKTLKEKALAAGFVDGALIVPIEQAVEAATAPLMRQIAMLENQLALAEKEIEGLKVTVAAVEVRAKAKAATALKATVTVAPKASPKVKLAA